MEKRGGKSRGENSQEINQFDQAVKSFGDSMMFGGEYSYEGINNGLRTVTDSLSEGLKPGDTNKLAERYRNIANVAETAAKFAEDNLDSESAIVFRTSAQSYRNVADVLNPPVIEKAPQVPQASQMTSVKK